MDITSPEAGSSNERQRILEFLDASDRKVDSQYENLTKKNKNGRKDEPKLRWSDIGSDIGSIPTSDQKIIRMAQIIAKYQEYGQRLISTPGNLTEKSDWYKREIARQIILRGEVRSSILLEAIEQAHGRVNEGLFYLAERVISNYIKSGSQNVRRGTGLPQVQPPQK